MRSLVVLSVLGATAYAQPADQCSVRVELAPTISATRVSMKVQLKNTERVPVKVSLGSTCGARFSIEGEPPATCEPTPCKDVPPKVVTIGAKKTFTLGTVNVDAKGSKCRHAIYAGSTLFRAAVVTDPAQSNVCTGAAVHVIRDENTGKLRKAKPSDGVIEQTVFTPPSPPTKKPRKPCPACGLGCPDGTPSSDVDANGCLVCRCEKHVFDKLPD